MTINSKEKRLQSWAMSNSYRGNPDNHTRDWHRNQKAAYRSEIRPFY
jgi:hypothetical protein